MGTISLASHEKPGCNPTLIDNILINSTENLICAGLFEEKVSHHHPIFCILDNNLPKNTGDSQSLPKYDYCESNVNRFIDEISFLATSQYDEYSEDNFNTFVNYLKSKIEENFL